MNEMVANRFTVGIAAVIFAGFWLAVSACMPDTHSHPDAWRPVAITQPKIRKHPVNTATLAATPEAKNDAALAEASSR
jgi:hypothetical protein